MNVLVLSGVVHTRPKGRLAPEPEQSRCRLTLAVPADGDQGTLYLGVDLVGRVAELACALQVGTVV